MIITDLKQLEQFRNVPAIYKLRFFTNHDKQYVGEGGDLYDRIVNQYPQEIKYCKKPRIIIKAIRKYGWNNIEIEIIDWGEHLRDNLTRLAKEMACIDFYNTLVQNGMGYNVRLFGKSTFGIKYTKEQCEAISERNKGENNGMWGKTHTPEVCEKLRNYFKIKCLKEGNPMFDFAIYTFKNKITGEIFVGYRYDFIRKYNLNRALVCFLIHKKRKSTKKWILIENIIDYQI